MATEILRPSSCDAAGTAYIVTPDSVSEENYHTLVNEIIADDDSTCITLTKTSNNSARVVVLFDSDMLRKNYSKITAARFVCRTKVDANDYFLRLNLLRRTGQVAQSQSSYEITFNDGTWLTSYFDINATDMVEAIESWLAFNNTLHPIQFEFYAANTVQSTTKNACSCSITQAYLEITYNDTTTETIYLKENGSWTSVPCTIYQKQNGDWITVDSTIFENGDRYTLQELT